MINGRLSRHVGHLDRPVYSYVCPNEIGPFHARLIQADFDGSADGSDSDRRPLYAVVPCQFSGSGSGSSGSGSGCNDNGTHRLGRLVQQDIEGRPLYAVEDPCCSGSASGSSSSGSSVSGSISASGSSVSGSDGSISGSISGSGLSISGSISGSEGSIIVSGELSGSDGSGGSVSGSTITSGGSISGLESGPSGGSESGPSGSVESGVSGSVESGPSGGPESGVSGSAESGASGASGESGVNIDCPCDGPFASSFAITIDALADDTCTECVPFVPPLVLFHGSIDCAWDSLPVTTACANVDDPVKEMTAMLRCSNAHTGPGTAAYMLLTFIATSGGVGATYELVKTNFQSNGVNVFSLASDQGCIWPATITLTP